MLALAAPPFCVDHPVQKYAISPALLAKPEPSSNPLFEASCTRYVPLIGEPIVPQSEKIPSTVNEPGDINVLAKAFMLKMENKIKKAGKVLEYPERKVSKKLVRFLMPCINKGNFPFPLM